MSQRPFQQVDVFTETAGYGNPLAVVLDGRGLDDEAMQRFARWTNLSETTFVLPPSEAARAQGADYQVRIFTPGGELPFAGHPTLGSCHAWLRQGGQPQRADEVVQECRVGLVRIRRDGSGAQQRLAFAAPPLTRSDPSPAVLSQVARALGLKPQQVLAAQVLDNGPVWMGLLLDQPQTVLALQPNHLELKALGQKVGVVAIEHPEVRTGLIVRSNREARAFGHNQRMTPPVQDATAPSLEVRAFAAPIGVPEDPVTGSLNASLAQWLIADGHAPREYIAAQGTCLDRAGRVHIRSDDSQQVWVGGASVTCIEGTVDL